MPKYCFVPLCHTNDGRKRHKDSNETKRPALFRAPKDPETLKLWRRAIPRKDREIHQNDVVCELHFSEDCVERYFRTVMPDGTIFSLERERPLLKKDSVPTIFPGLPSYLSNYKKKRKPPMERKFVEKEDEVNLCKVTDISEQDIPKELNFHDLTQYIASFDMPSVWWCKNFVENYIALVCWDDSYVISKKIIFDRNLHIKIFLHDQLVTIEKFLRLHNLDDVQNVLETVDTLKVCRSVLLWKDQRHPYCRGYLADEETDFCTLCAVHQKYESLRTAKMKESLSTRLKVTSQKLKVASTKNRRQEKRINLLKRQVKILKASSLF